MRKFASEHADHYSTTLLVYATLGRSEQLMLQSQMQPSKCYCTGSIISAPPWMSHPGPRWTVCHVQQSAMSLRLELATTNPVSKTMVFSARGRAYKEFTYANQAHGHVRNLGKTCMDGYAFFPLANQSRKLRHHVRLLKHSRNSTEVEEQEVQEVHDTFSSFLRTSY